MSPIAGFLDALILRTRLVMLLSSIFIIIVVHIFQYGFGYQPCDLCYYQRYPYYLVIGIMTLALLADGKSDGGFSNVGFLLLGLAVLAMFTDAGIAVYHVGVEQKWWQGPTACSTEGAGTDSIEDMLTRLSGTRVVSCGEPAWTLYGISMAGYNIAYALGLGLFGAYGWNRERLKRASR